MVETPADVIKECRRIAIRKVTIAPGKIYNIRPDYRNGKLVISEKGKRK